MCPQKGTVGGVLMDQTDMPYTSEGIVPDLLFGHGAAGTRRPMCCNSHGIPV